MPWTVERDDLGGIIAFEVPVDFHNPMNMFETELAAVEYGISCAEGWRDSIAGSLSTLRRRARVLKKRSAR